MKKIPLNVVRDLLKGSSATSARRAARAARASNPLPPLQTVRSPDPPPPESRTRRQRDPSAHRPTAICDPYGNAGRPLADEDVRRVVKDVGLDSRWHLVPGDGIGDAVSPPRALRRTFVHPSFLAGGEFVRHLAALADVGGHGFSSLTLRRDIGRCPVAGIKKYIVRTDVECRTEVIGGVSYEDVHLAMQMDVETGRGGQSGGLDVQGLWTDVDEPYWLVLTYYSRVDFFVTRYIGTSSSVGDAALILRRAY
eukprot:CAMPEP_0194328162 /NCGR_PEP_ID=MMETSP0171-20130528/43750_1 /TAXON_ID=218684 /ORGANISM="Corethron pennatum, Strain L29A3" /LENGTH=251 /DNA_ID=CAMNT_0039088401 /DNA_START=22 /DNA_END=778 /DNA_ORIENTATION=+